MENKKNELFDTYVRLGKCCHQQFLRGHQQDDILSEISRQIVQIEKEIYSEEISLFPKKEDMICPECGSTYDEESLFCANCGCNLEAFYQGKKVCATCDALIDHDANFCGICGAIQAEAK